MSEQATEEDSVLLSYNADAAFAQLMDTLAPEAEPAAAAPAGTPGVPAPATTGQPAAPAEGAPGGATGPATPAAGDGGQQAVPGAVATPGTTVDGQPARPGPGTGNVEFSSIQNEFGTLSIKLEEGIQEVRRREALAAVREEYPKYFEALQKHPRALVGQEVPSLTGDGMERLRDSQDAADWQEGVKSILIQEANSRASTLLEDDKGYLQTVHNSIELFQNNGDLVPGTKGFSKELADEFVRLAKPYEVRNEDNKKLLGWSIPVQPLVDMLREQIKVRHASAPPAPAPAAAAPSQAAPAAPPVVPPPKQAAPQQGIPSAAGAVSSDSEDFSTLFGTLGLPNFRI